MTYRQLLLPALLTAGLLAQVSCESETDLKLKKYKVVGQRVYVENCANCHQTDGKGLAAIYPPINGSDYLKNKEKVICLIRHGLNGPIMVNGRRWNRPMPANPQLTDIDVATLTTYLYTQWGGETSITDVKEVSRVLATCQN